MSAPTYSTGGPAPFTGGFASFFPELATSDSDRQTWVTNMLSLEWAKLSSDFWGSDRDEAALLTVASSYVDAFVPQKGRRVSSKSAGGWSKSYEPSNGTGSKYKDRLDALANKRAALAYRVSL